MILFSIHIAQCFKGFLKKKKSDDLEVVDCYTLDITILNYKKGMRLQWEQGYV